MTSSSATTAANTPLAAKRIAPRATQMAIDTRPAAQPVNWLHPTEGKNFIWVRTNDTGVRATWEVLASNSRRAKEALTLPPHLERAGFPVQVGYLERRPDAAPGTQWFSMGADQRGVQSWLPVRQISEPVVQAEGAKVVIADTEQLPRLNPTLMWVRLGRVGASKAEWQVESRDPSSFNTRAALTLPDDLSRAGPSLTVERQADLPAPPAGSRWYSMTADYTGRQVWLPVVPKGPEFLE